MFCGQAGRQTGRQTRLTIRVLLHSLDVGHGRHGVARTEGVDEIGVHELLVKGLAEGGAHGIDVGVLLATGGTRPTRWHPSQQ